jgi:DNA-binding MarR family transcriptional regulator
MERIAFALKRAFQGSLRVLRTMLDPHGLTPARFDLLRAAAKAATYRGQDMGTGVYQSKLARELGVTRVTVCRMARSLEERGFIARRADLNRRERWITFTDAGAAALLRAITDLGAELDLAAQRTLRAAVDDDGPRALLLESLRSVRSAVGDRALFDAPADPSTLGRIFPRQGPRYGPPSIGGRALYPFCLDDLDAFDAVTALGYDPDDP